MSKKTVCAVSLLLKTLDVHYIENAAQFLSSGLRKDTVDVGSAQRGATNIMEGVKLKRLRLYSLERRLEDVWLCTINFCKIVVVIDKVNASSSPTAFELRDFQ